MNSENKITINNLIYALLFLVFGIVLLTSTTDLISIASKVIGVILIIFGIIKAIIYTYKKGKYSNYSLSELIIGIIVIGLGVLLLLYSSTLSFVIRIVVGLWILFAGVNRIIFSIYIRQVDKIGFRIYNGFNINQLIGLFIIIYSVIEIIDYIYYKINSKKYESKTSSNKMVKIKDERIVDAIVDEE